MFVLALLHIHLLLLCLLIIGLLTMDQYSLRGSNGVTSKEVLYSANIFRIRKKKCFEKLFYDYYVVPLCIITK